MHLEAINTGMENRYLRTAYLAKPSMSSFFFLLGRVGRKLIWVCLEHLLLIGASNCPKFNMGNEDKEMDIYVPSSADAPFGRPRTL
jgi:hypothetical protein